MITFKFGVLRFQVNKALCFTLVIANYVVPGIASVVTGYEDKP